MSTTKHTRTGMEVTIDPLNAFEGIKDSKLLEACGLLAYFAADVHMMEPESVQEAWDGLMDNYGFGDVSSDHWGTVEDMVYKSSEDDPDMKPLARFGLTEDIDFLVYQYAICAVTDGETTIMGRMD